MLQLFFCSQLLVRDNWSFKTEDTKHSKTRISFWIFLGSRILPNLSKNWPQEAARLVRVCVTCEGVCCEGVTGSVCDMWGCVLWGCHCECVWHVRVCVVWVSLMWVCVTCECVWHVRVSLWVCVTCECVWKVRVCEMWWKLRLLESSVCALFYHRLKSFFIVM